ncbi:ComF family protein [Parasulfitobacter algicola]|uniref:ComF family protein n=1 Tax=Parasulfitobacter algicola TaxID=2614809 RepID=A0ABX2IU08_9RHOB|nr:ComF family protein [Sulfitobacter algicola]NSX53528.1 ComF family protein [Sulfitobacter algicola]
MQTALRIIYPSQCLTCDEMTETDFALCGPCWGETPFLGGTVCDKCGVPLPGDADHAVHCDDCMTLARPWSQGRAAVAYTGNARKMVLQLKHADRIDFARPAAGWMAQVAKPLILPNMIVAPVPLHWRRLLKRRYNQSALLSKELAVQLSLENCPDLLVRGKRTKPMEGMTVTDRFKMLEDAIHVHSKRLNRIQDRPILLIDDVMTSGATLAATTEACFVAGASHVNVLVLARVMKQP